MGSRSSLFVHSTKTKAGIFQILATEQGLTGINFPGRHISVSSPHFFSPKAQKILKASAFHLKTFFNRGTYHSRKIPVNWNLFGPFEKQVLKTLQRIPSGKTISYSALARRSGHPRAARAVGNALNRNPIPILIPCHRVIHKDGSLGKYRGGSKWKQKLLTLELK